MKRLFVGLALAIVVAGAAIAMVRVARAVRPDTPQGAVGVNPPSGEWGTERAAVAMALRLNGLSAEPDVIIMSPGEPVIAEVQFRHGDRHAKQPILLQPPSGSWAGRVKILVSGAGGRVESWPFAVAGKPSPGGLALQPATVTTLVLRMEKAASAAIAPGRYSIFARLDLSDGSGLRGIVETPPASAEVVAPSSPPAGAALGQRQLLRVRDALLHGDVAAAESAAVEMLRADPRRPEAYLCFALVYEARSQRSRAILSAEMAIARATGEGALSGAPVEYYELLRRLENLPVAAGL